MIDAPKIHSDLLWDLSCLFIVLAMVYFVTVFYFKKTIKTKFKKVRLQKKALTPMISEFLFIETNASKNEKTNYVNLKVEIRQLLKDDFNRKVLTEILLDLRKDVSGDTQWRLFKLYTDLGLHLDAYEKLRSWRWEVISKGISELTQMNVIESYSLITKFINDKRATIRKQAEIATVTLKHEGINYFLDTTTFKISEWQQLKLLDVLRNFEDYRPPAFKAWLTSKNTHTVLFALRLIKYYSQNDAFPSIIELVKHHNNQIKQEAIFCIKEFNIVAALNVLKIVFWNSSAPLKISILDTIGAIGSENDLQFLRSIESKEPDFSVKSKALSAINTIAPDSILPTKGIVDISQYTIPEDIPNIQEAPSASFSKLGNAVSINSSASNENEPADLEANKPIVRPVEVEEKAPRNNDKPIANENCISAVDATAINLGFLPIVIADTKTGLVSEDFLNNPISKVDEPQILDLPVIFHQVHPGRKTPNELFMPSELDDQKIIEDSDLNFLPWVVAHENHIASEVQNTEEDIQPYRFKTNIIEKAPEKGHKDFAVIYETISSLKIQDSRNVQKDPKSKMIFPDQKMPALNPISIKAIDLHKVRNMNICYEIISAEPTNNNEMSIIWPFEDEGLDTAKNSKTADVEKEKAPKDSENKLYKDTEKLVVNHQFYDVETLAMIHLLDNLEELGDEREIPLLLEYLEKETDSEIKERIRQLVKKFANWEPVPQKNSQVGASGEDSPPSYSLVKELFDNSDEEAQIILLDSLIDVMDEKELHFLHQLENHPNEQIRQKARIALMALKKSLECEPPTKKAMIDLSSENESSDFEEESKEHPIIRKKNEEPSLDIFEVEFEFTPQQGPEMEHAGAALSNSLSLVDSMRSFSNRLIKKFNG